jgi:hypothetical protein
MMASFTMRKPRSDEEVSRPTHGPASLFRPKSWVANVVFLDGIGRPTGQHTDCLGGPFAGFRGNALPPTTNGFETSHDRGYVLTTLVDGSLPITTPSTLCVLWHPVIPKRVHLFSLPTPEPLRPRPMPVRRLFIFLILRGSLPCQSKVMRSSGKP